MVAAVAIAAGPPRSWAEDLETPATLSALQSSVSSTLSAKKIVGAAYAIVENGDVVAVETFGSEDQSGAQPITDDTLFRVGSISKNVTSLLAMSMVERGHFALDDTLAKHLPDHGIANRWDGTDPIRLVHLLEHTAGLRGSSYAEYKSSSSDVSPNEYLQSAKPPLKAQWRPGTFYSYANPGHTVMGAVIESRSGQDFDTVVRQAIFNPLGMTRSTFASSAAFEIQDPISSYDGSGHQTGHWRMSIRPSGSMTSSISDMAKLARFYATSGRWPVGQKILSERGLRRMRAGNSSIHARNGYAHAYGLGTFSFLAAGHFFYGHWGKTDGFLANLGYLPDTKQAFVLLSNTSNRRAMHEARELIAGYLTRKRLPRAAPFSRPASTTSGFEGWYQLLTYEEPLRSWFFRLSSLTHVRPVTDTWVVRTLRAGFVREPLVPTGDNLFRIEADTFSSIAFAKTPDRRMTFLSRNQVTLGRIPDWQAWATLAGLALLAFSLVTTAPFLILAPLARLIRGPGKGLWVPTFVFGLAGASLVGLPYAFYKLALSPPIATVAQVGELSASSITLAALSLVWPLLVIIATILVFRLWAAFITPTRIWLTAVVLGYGVAIVFLASESWLPLMTWGV